jgi:creatinine amidohydrolase
MAKGNTLASYSWQDISEMNREDQVVLIPLGSIENQGAHLPLGVDSYAAEKIAVDVGQKTGALVAPVITVGYSAWFMEFPGTMTFQMETFIQMIKEYCESLMSHGFRKFVFINCHQGNSPAIDIIGREWKLRYELTIAMVAVWKIAHALARRCDLSQEKAFTHGGEIMTSIMMAIDPGLVNMNRAIEEYLKSPNPHFKRKTSAGLAEFEGIEISLYEKARACSTSGTMGNPMTANPELGRWMINEIESYVIRMLQAL